MQKAVTTPRQIDVQLVAVRLAVLLADTRPRADRDEICDDAVAIVRECTKATRQPSRLLAKLLRKYRLSLAPAPPQSDATIALRTCGAAYRSARGDALLIVA